MPFTFGGYSLHTISAGFGLLVQSKDVSAPVVSPIVTPIARRFGVVRSGEQVGARDIDLIIKIVGSSRTDLISRLDALKKALRLRGRDLVIYEDSRYFRDVDCISAEAKLAGGANVTACTVNVLFRAYDPVAYAASSSSYDSGTVALTLGSGVWSFPAIAISGGGTNETYPLIRLTNKTSTGSTTLTSARNSGSNYTTLPVNATSFSASVGDVLQLSNGTNTQNVTVATAFSAGATTLTVTSFTANTTYGVGASVTKVTQWTAITIAQTTDSLSLTTYSTVTVPLPSANNSYVDIQCDPVTGMSIETNGSGSFHDPVGTFPLLQPDSTTINISVTCSSAVSAQATISWSSRYL